MNLVVLDNPSVCKRCGTASQVMLLDDNVCGGCLTKKDVNKWLSKISAESTEGTSELPDDAEELRSVLRNSASHEIGEDALVQSGSMIIGKRDWLDQNLSTVESDGELRRLLERAGSGDSKSAKQALRRISVYKIMRSGLENKLFEQLGSPIDDRERVLFEIARTSEKDSHRNDAIVKIIAFRKLDISFD